MDYLLKIEEVLILLKKKGYNDLEKRLSEVKDSSFTASELLLTFTYELKLIIRENPQLREDFSIYLHQLVEFCYNIGLIIGD